MLSRPRLLIIGAGGFGREVLGTVRLIERHSVSLWDVGGFLDDNTDQARRELSIKGYGEPVLSSIQDYQPQDQDRFICAVGTPKIKLKLCDLICSRGGQFTNVIDPTSWQYETSTMGKGNILLRSTGLSANSKIGNHNALNSFVGIGHDSILEDGCTLNAFCDITGNTYLERGVYMGSHAVVCPGVRVGAFAIIGAGSVALRNVKAGSTIIGVPGKSFYF